MDKSDEVLHMARTGELPLVKYPSTPQGAWDELTLIPAQLARLPLMCGAEADISAVIGKNALIPLRLNMPVIISHMSYGSVDAPLKRAIARAASGAGIANGSGDGGVLREEIELSAAYIYEYTPGLYGLTPENLDRCSAVEIKLGQGAGGGMPLPIPSDTDESVFEMRNASPSPFFSSPGRFPELNSADDLRLMVDGLREGCCGKPVGLKISAGDIEGDLAAAATAGADFVTIDAGQGGWLGRPWLLGGGNPVYALCRAKKYIDDNGIDLDIIIAGGIHTPADAAKAVALGATAAAPASAVLKAGCGEFAGTSPFSEEETFLRIRNYLTAMENGLREICAYTGHSSISKLSLEDVAAIRGDVALYTDIRHI